LRKKHSSVSVSASLTGPFKPRPTAWVSGDSAPTKMAQPPAISSTSAPATLHPRALAASAASRRRASSASAKIIAPFPVTASPKAASYKYANRNSQSSGAWNDVRQLRAQRGANAGEHAGGDQGAGGVARGTRHCGVRPRAGEARSTGACRARARLRSTGMSAATTERLDLPVSGMTCAACARTIERTLSNTPGVERAMVNLATNTATVEYDAGRVRPADFVNAIENLGYGVPTEGAAPGIEATEWRTRFWQAAAAGIPVVVLGM